MNLTFFNRLELGHFLTFFNRYQSNFCFFFKYSEFVFLCTLRCVDERFRTNSQSLVAINNSYKKSPSLIFDRVPRILCPKYSFDGVSLILWNMWNSSPRWSNTFSKLQCKTTTMFIVIVSKIMAFKNCLFILPFKK